MIEARNKRGAVVKDLDKGVPRKEQPRIVKHQTVEPSDSGSDYGHNQDSAGSQFIFPETSTLSDKPVRMNEKKAYAPVYKQQNIPDGDTLLVRKQSASSKVFSIFELREAILIAHGRQCRPIVKDPHWICTVFETIHEETLGPAVELFPLRRVNHAFNTMILPSPTLLNTTILPSLSPALQSLMCLSPGPGFISPLRWFLHKLGMTVKVRNQWTYKHYDDDDSDSADDDSDSAASHPVIDLERYEIIHNDHNVPPRSWKLPVAWEAETAAWRDMKVFNDEEPLVSDVEPYQELGGIFVDYTAIVTPDEEQGWNPEWDESPAWGVLLVKDKPTLYDAYQLVKDIATKFERMTGQSE